MADVITIKAPSHDRELQPKVVAVLARLQAGEDVPLNPVSGAADPRARLVAVDSSHHAVVFHADFGTQAYFFYIGTYPADEAFSVAQTSKLNINPINGVMEVVRVGEPADSTTAHDAPAKATGAADSAAAAEDDANQASAAEQPVTTTTGPARHAADKDNVPEVGAKAARSNTGTRLVADGHTPDSLFEELGLPRELSAAVMRTSTNIQFMDVLRYAPAWQQEAFRSLSVGQPVDQIREDLGLGTALDDSVTEQEKIEHAIAQPATQMQFRYTSDAADLRDAIESSNFEAWRTFLHPSQHEQATKYFSGSSRVFGGAGTGKTVVAVHRARNIALGLLSSDKPTGSRIILTTYTRGLASALKDMVVSLDPKMHTHLTEKIGEEGLYVSGIDALAHTIINASTAADRNTASEILFGTKMYAAPGYLNENEELTILERCLAMDGGILEGAKAEPSFLLAEWVDVVIANKATNRADYLRTKRVGRGVALNRKERVAVWNVLEAFRRECSSSRKFGYATMAALAATLIDVAADNPTSPITERRVADHIIIDEAQDFHAGHWLLVRALVPQGPNDIFISEDGHQRIYGRPVVLSHFDIHTRGRSRGLKINYRTTEENLDYANEILTGDEFVNSEGELDNTLYYRSLRNGPEPIIINCPTSSKQADTAAEYINQWQSEAGPGRAVSIGILMRQTNSANKFVTLLNNRGINAEYRKGPSTKKSDTVAVMTMHGAKGLEFTHVILAGIDPEGTPHVYGFNRMDEGAQKEAVRREKSLLYVASSRARDVLVALTA
ncbi:hypothetical protein C1Y63_01145 [Corynebacterium sp. 13CS0277]|uniref:3'-5' exonuclease n=1 Tax=Corynebacterium sp. 13CS0277 TaxID=2071994 RepID=UPI000D03CEAC|nr:3'-5' exonuclease [Corynebacterium sp. 13CS0277]PRQ12426.1 hypothetical protein C1Y63_01145 [Corynebacterium sp. 13CS0277]